MPSVVPVPFVPFRQDDLDGNPLEGGLLFSYLAGTSTEHATYADPAGTTANANPVVLNDVGSATVYLEQGVAYKLVQYDQFGNLMWSVDQLASGGAGQPPVTVTCTAGSGVLVLPACLPAGVRVRGVTTRNVTTLGTSQGLTGFLIGGMGVEDGWGQQDDLTVGATTGLGDFHRGDEPIATQPEDVLLTALGGLFDGVGSIQVTVYLETL